MVESTFVHLRDATPSRGSDTGAHAWLARACVVIPALDAEDSIFDVITGVRTAIPELANAIFVVDDGSGDATARIAQDAGCAVISSSHVLSNDGERSNTVERPRNNRGKGAALRAGFIAARTRGMSVALTIDADGQHPPEEARRVLFASSNEKTLVLGVRDLVRDGAPRANRFSNGISNHFLSRFARRTLHDTQCGLRRYPLRETLALPTRSVGYDFEAEVLLRAIWNGLEVVEKPVRVLYPEHRKTHFRIRRDVRRIIKTVLATVGDHWLRPEGSAPNA